MADPLVDIMIAHDPDSRYKPPTKFGMAWGFLALANPMDIMIPRDLDSRFKISCKIWYGLALPTDGLSLCERHDPP
jgi:hypothetical protein